MTTSVDARADNRCSLRERCRDVGVATLMCGILALFLFSTAFGPWSDSSRVIGVLDIAVFAFVMTLTPGGMPSD